MSQRDRGGLGDDVRRAAGVGSTSASGSHDARERGAPFAMVGWVTGILGLTLAVFSPWILGALAADQGGGNGADDRNAVTLERGEEADDSGSWIDRAKRWKLKLTFGSESAEEEPDPAETSAAQRVSEALPPVTLGLGVIAIVFGMVGLIRRERSLIGGLALGLGAATLIVQLTALFVGLVVLAFFVFGVLGVLGLAPS